jgi:hypothetical protein
MFGVGGKMGMLRGRGRGGVVVMVKVVKGGM